MYKVSLYKVIISDYVQTKRVTTCYTSVELVKSSVLILNRLGREYVH